MTDDEIDKLIERAIKAHKQEQFEDELALWEQVCVERPGQLEFLHNVALAKMNVGHLEDALNLFDELAERAPHLSRVHNNRALLLLRLGADIQHLLPAFMMALYLSETNNDFVNHVINIYNSAAHGPDFGGEELLDSLEEPIVKLVSERFVPEDVAKNIKCFKDLLDVYRHIARYRLALGRKEWKAAEKALATAQNGFMALGLANFANGSDVLRERLLICKGVFGLLEDIGSDPSLPPSAAMERATALMSKAATLRNENQGSVQQRLMDVIRCFLAIDLIALLA